jgi:hypothetical protein
MRLLHAAENWFLRREGKFIDELGDLLDEIKAWVIVADGVYPKNPELKVIHLVIETCDPQHLSCTIKNMRRINITRDEFIGIRNGIGILKRIQDDIKSGELEKRLASER